MLCVTIDGQQHELAAGLTVLQALNALGVEVPQLCHDERVAPAAVCRLCLVEVEGEPHPVPACATPLSNGMAVRTHSRRLEADRRTILAMLARRHPADVSRLPETPFLRVLRAYGVDGELGGTRDPSLVDDSHPYLYADMSRCIDCYRCVRICNELQGQFVWMVLNRGDRTRIVPDSGTTLRESSCVSCGACVDTCPTNALEDKTLRSLGLPTDWTRTTCPYCGVGCEMEVGTREGGIVTVRPSLDAPVSKGHLCAKGRYAFGFLRAPDRVTAPMIREGERWREVSWSEAIGFVAGRLRGILERHGPRSVGVLGSARATNEENYVAQKLARVVLGTHNVDCCARVCHAPSAAALKAMLGTGAATNSYDDIEQARTLLVCGANVTENHPIVGARIKQAALRGANLVVIDPRRIELAEHADIHLQLRPGTNVPLLNAMAQVIMTEGLVDEAFVRERVSERDGFEAFVANWAPERAAAICGVEAALIREAARLYARERPSMSVHGLGMTEHVQGTEGVMCLVNLALLTGNLGKPGTGVNPLRGQNNVQGAAHMGCEPENLTGFVPVEEGRARFESAWDAPLPSTRGLDLMTMLDAARAGRFRALWAIGYDVLLTNPDARATREALASLELLVVQDLFLNETARDLGTVFLPVAASFEKDGTFMNAERRIQRVRRVVAPPAGAKADWEILCEVARAMGHPEGFGFQSAEEIWNEVRALWKVGAGISYARLEQGGIQWPCPSEDHPGTRVLHAEVFPIGRRASLGRIDFHPTPETTTEDYPFLLMTGRTLYQFNAGTMTGRTLNMVLRPRDVLSVSLEDARQLGLEDGERVRIRSCHGEAVLPANLDPAMRPGELFATFHTAEAFLNRVTGPHRDRHTDTPEYKVTAVRVEKAPRLGA
jgi:formate dehydrogenase major subunit